MKARDKAYEALLTGIQSGALAPGVVITEVEQSDRIGVSRTPMREAINKLVADGMIVQQSPRVLVVSGFDAQVIRDLFQARQAIEQATVRAAAVQGNVEIFRAFSAAFRQSKPNISAESAAEYSALIERFDHAVDDAANNVYLTNSLRIIRTHLTRARRLAYYKPQRLLDSVAEHSLIAEAIVNRDTELAVHATFVHLHNSLGSILDSLENPPSEGKP